MNLILLLEGDVVTGVGVGVGVVVVVAFVEEDDPNTS
jgi:hypothetical protein